MVSGLTLAGVLKTAVLEGPDELTLEHVVLEAVRVDGSERVSLD